jgi:predicted transcriptional regulator
MARMVRIQVQLSSDQVKRLRELAKENRTSVAGMVRKSVTDALLRPAITPLRRDRWQRSVAAIGRFAAGQSHDSFRRPQ